MVVLNVINGKRSISLAEVTSDHTTDSESLALRQLDTSPLSGQCFSSLVHFEHPLCAMVITTMEFVDDFGGLKLLSPFFC